mmetsp:Transcript_33168/g.72737  ORF Transcript_33168/g.72737 Transcript_33168/m.72737 type:complete len:426 (-) Transcript_33168:1647-2924(-)
MSSLSATQADGYYAPPEYYESGAYKKQSISQYAGSKGHNQYLQRSVVRFELPYDGFCTKCSAHVGKGTRFNAKKSHVDDYFTTKIWEFETRCRACADCTFKIRTNPKGRCFDYVEGIRRKVEEFDTQEAGTEGVIDTDVGNGIIPSNGPDDAAVNGATGTSTRSTGGSSVPGTSARSAADGVNGVSSNPLSRLERTAVGERKAQMEFGRLESIKRLNNATLKDDAATNAAVRATYRKARQGKKRRLSNAARIGLGNSIELTEPVQEDVAASKDAFGTRQILDNRARKRETDAFKMIRTGSIFGARSKSKRSTADIEQKRISRPSVRRNRNTSATMKSAGPSTPEQDACANSGLSQNRSTRHNKRLQIKPPLLHQGQKNTFTAVTGTLQHRAQHSGALDESGSGEGKNALSALSALSAYGSESDSD